MKSLWVVEMTIDGSVKAVPVSASTAEQAKDAAEAKHPEATRIYGAYTEREWSRLSKAKPVKP